MQFSDISYSFGKLEIQINLSHTFFSRSHALYETPGTYYPYVEELHTNRLISYTYDRLNRLTEENIKDPTNGNETISYAYDDFGNRLGKTDSSGTISYDYDDNDRLLTAGDVTYTYDNNGNTKTKTDASGTITYGYDYENRLVSVQSSSGNAEYAYDADGIRVSSTANGVVTNFIVDKNRPYAQVLEEKDDAGALIVSYVYGDDLISQNRPSAGSGTVYYHYDGIGSTRALTDDAANVTDTYVYEAFGNLLTSSGGTENDYLFTGEQYDANSDSYYLRARYYNPGIGRFVTKDSFAGNPADPVTLHKYLYANANPVIITDPSGEIGIYVSILQDQIQQVITRSQKAVHYLKISRRLAATFCRISAKIAMPYNKLAKLFPNLPKVGKNPLIQKHHVYGNADMLRLYYHRGYRTKKGFSILLFGGSWLIGSPHYEANEAQKNNLDQCMSKQAEKALIAAGCRTKDVKEIMKAADHYNKMMKWSGLH